MEKEPGISNSKKVRIPKQKSICNSTGLLSGAGSQGVKISAYQDTEEKKIYYCTLRYQVPVNINCLPGLGKACGMRAC